MTILLIISTLVQLVYWFYYFNSLAYYQPAQNLDSPQKSTPVSIIICAKNAAKLLKANLPSVLQQNHHNYDVNIANDHSTDGTLEILKRIDNEKRILFVHKVTKNNAGKREALWEGIVKSRHNWVMLTDADCRPRSDGWIATMMEACTSPKHRVILGYSPYITNKTLVSWWSHFEAWITALLYLSFAHRGQPYMGVGRNLSYDKALLTKKKLDRYAHLASGDDDLTIMQMATAENTAICLDPASFVETDAEPTWGAYFKQKRRHYSTATSYTTDIILLLSGFSLSLIAFYGLFFWVLFTQGALIALGLYLLRLLPILPIVHRLSRRLEAEFHLLTYPILDLALACYYVIFSFSVLFPKKKSW